MKSLGVSIASLVVGLMCCFSRAEETRESNASAEGCTEPDRSSRPCSSAETQKGSAAIGSPTIDAAGTVHIPSLEMPLSPHMSTEAKAKFISRFKQHTTDHAVAETRPAPGSSLADSSCPAREAMDNSLRPLIERARALYPVRIDEAMIAGVRTDVVTPETGISRRNRNRVLINLHGGGYDCSSAGGLDGQIEAIPIAGAGKFKVITVDYRTSPHSVFPAATEDVTAVYRTLLKRYKPNNIGIYGCSTGATLSAGSIAWFQKKGLPRPGALGLFGDGATQDDHVDGDGWFINVPLTLGKRLAADETFAVFVGGGTPYMKGTDYNDPMVAPVVSHQVLSRFPPTLVVTGTRDVGLSEALYTHTQLVKAGVVADLHVWEGMWHCFFMDVDMPESKDMFEVTTIFFDRHLGQ